MIYKKKNTSTKQKNLPEKADGLEIQKGREDEAEGLGNKEEQWRLKRRMKPAKLESHSP